MLDEVNVDKYPTFADLGAGNLAGAGLFLQRHGMDVQQVSSSVQIQGLHNVSRDRSLVLDQMGGPDSRGKGCLYVVPTDQRSADAP